MISLLIHISFAGVSTFAVHQVELQASFSCSGFM